MSAAAHELTIRQSGGGAMVGGNRVKKIVLFSIAILVALYFFISYPLVTHSDSNTYLGQDISVNVIFNQPTSLKLFQDYTYSRPAPDNQSVSNQTNDSSAVYIEDILIAIKSTKKYHESRLKLFLETWIPQAKQSTYVLTDADDNKTAQLVGADKFINTKCPASHRRQDLACKLQSMYNLFISKIQQHKWFCVGDDDTYIVIPNLVKTLRQYDDTQRWYIGKNSLPHKYRVQEHTNGTTLSYWFATGGALICFSKAMIQSMLPLCGSGGFIKRAEEIRNPDDTTIGYVCNYLLGVNLTTIPEFHSHLEPMWQINPSDFHKQVTISWGKVKEDVVQMSNTLLIRDEIEKFPVEKDPTRVLSIHCYLYPQSDECHNIKAKMEQQTIPPSQGSDHAT